MSGLPTEFIPMCGAVWMADRLRDYILVLDDNGVDLSERLMIAVVLADLCSLAGLGVPVAVEVILGDLPGIS